MRKATEEEKRLARSLPTAMCSLCKQEQTRENFEPDPKKTNGLLSNCRGCRRSLKLAFYQRHKVNICAKKRQKEKDNPDKHKADCARWRAANRESRRAKNKERYAANKDAAKKALIDWKLAHPERAKATADRCRKEWRVKNRERYHEKSMQAYHKRRALKLSQDYEPLSIRDIVLRDGPDCYICGRLTDLMAPPFSANKAELEHVVALSRGGSHTGPNLRCACYKCNRTKGYRFTPRQTHERIFLKRPARRLLSVVDYHPSQRLILVDV